MKKVEFGISDTSTENRLSAGWDRLDLDNWQGQYLGVITAGMHHFLVTKRLKSGNDNDERIQVNEIEFDIYPDGSMVFYYNLKKSENAIRLENDLNRPELISHIRNEQNLAEIYRFGYRSRMQSLLETQFFETNEIDYPEGFDFQKNDTSELPRIRVEQMSVTGIPDELFKHLKKVKENAHFSVYEMANNELDLENDKGRKR